MSRKTRNRFARLLADRQKELAQRLLDSPADRGFVFGEINSQQFSSLVRRVTDRSLLVSCLLSRGVIDSRDIPDAVEAGGLCGDVDVVMSLSREFIRAQLWDEHVEVGDIQSALESIAWQRVSIESGQAVWGHKTNSRKAAGAFYTPNYVVHYIIRRLLQGVDARNCLELRVLDPACGTGRFLLGTLDALLSAAQHYGVESSLDSRLAILKQSVFGVDSDPWAISIAETALKFWLLESDTERLTNNQLGWLLRPLENLSCGNVLTTGSEHLAAASFDVVLGNPPYLRERDSKSVFDEIAATEFGGKYRTARMDLWYYFVHRGVELLRDGGQLSYIVNSYWTAGAGAEKVLQAFREEMRLVEITDLEDLPVFDGVTGKHMIFRAKKTADSSCTRIRKPEVIRGSSAERFLREDHTCVEYSKSPRDLFTPHGLDLSRPGANIAPRFHQCSPLGDMGLIRQGIAENPASINHRTNERFGNPWQVGDGVFVISQAELEAMQLSTAERTLIRPYHQLKDLGRFYVAPKCSHHLIYSTKQTCPDIEPYNALNQHLAGYRQVMESRRETRDGNNRWWHLHWPRDESLWKTPKIVCLQMAERPSFAVARQDVYVSFSANVFVPQGVKESLDYIAAVLNSSVLRDWFETNAKRRGIGLDISGRVLRQAPIHRINFQDAREVELHERLANDAKQMSEVVAQVRESDQTIRNLDARIDAAVSDLYSWT